MSCSKAQHLTQQFIAQLEEIGFLLTTRYVEDVHSDTRLPITKFITSGGEDEFLAAIQSLVDIDERSKGIPGKLLSAITKALAVITISGTLRRRDITTIELEVRLTQHWGNQTSIIVPITSTDSADDLDDVTAKQIARLAALRLLLRAGAVSHIASSEESLDAFLDGLAASADQNWWRASASYQRAIQYEESKRGSFGIGRYHLGFAQVKQGDIQAGQQNFIQAERSGKPLADVPYMLALLLLREKWDHLNDPANDAHFEHIKSYAHRAIALRRTSPEAFHLLGVAYYQRGKLIDRRETTIKKEQENNQAASQTQPTQKLVEIIPPQARDAYDQAIPYLIKAKQFYDRRIHLLQNQIINNTILNY